MRLDLTSLSTAQRQAVLAGDGPLLVVAGPGSGKTLVLAARIAFLITGRQVAPSSILAITFSTKAARELKGRLEAMLGEPGSQVDVMTFHSFGLRVIRQWSLELGFRSGPVVVYGDEEARKVFCRAAIALRMESDRQTLGNLYRQVQRYRLGSALPAPLRLPPGDPIPLLAQTYEALLYGQNTVDFPAMLVLPLRLLESHPEVLRLLQDAYAHILCDECQDVCSSQYQLLIRLADRRRNLSVVGDPLQVLYSWRGASVQYLTGFPHDFPDARVLVLNQNFRSTGRILAIANALGAPLPCAHQLWTANAPGEPVFLYHAGDEQREAAFVAAEIERLCSDGWIEHPGQAAVLVRTNGQTRELELALRERHLPYRVAGHIDLLARREVQDALAYLRLACNPGDVEALARIVDVPPRGLARVAHDLRTKPAVLQELMALSRPYGMAAADAAQALVRLVAELHAASASLTPSSLLDLALEKSGYRAWLEAQPDGESRLNHLGDLRRLAQAAEGDLSDWLAELQLGEDLSASGDGSRRVLLSTIHGAKGGEWRTVFVTGLEEGLLPHARSLLGQDSSGSALEEERRIAYVAVTRPQERLYLTCCRTRRRGTGVEARHPSRFLTGLPPDGIRRVG